MRLIDADALKEQLSKETNIKNLGLWLNILQIIDNAPTVEPEITDDDLRACMAESHHLGYELAEIKFKKPQGKWFDYIAEGTLKARHGDYVLYKVDYLLDHLTREVYIMEGARKMRGKEE